MIDRTLIPLIADTILDNIDRVAAASHRPENVTRLWQDANARYLMAEAIVMALAPTPENVECQTCGDTGVVPQNHPIAALCPECGSRDPRLHPATQAGGEVIQHLGWDEQANICRHEFHTPTPENVEEP